MACRATLRVGVAILAFGGLLSTLAVVKNVFGTEDVPAAAAREEWRLLTSKAGVIGDVSARILFAPTKNGPNLAYRFFDSKRLGLARIDLVLTKGGLQTYYIDVQRRHVFTRIAEKVFALDAQGSEPWLAMYNLFASVTDISIRPSREFYCAGMQTVSKVDPNCWTVFCLI
jgi:hypothetical protein